MKKIISLLITSAVLLCVTGCNSASFIRTEKISGNQTTTVTTAIPAETNASVDTGDDNTVLNTETSATTTTSEPVESTSNESESVDESNSKIIADLRKKVLENLGINPSETTKPAETTKPVETFKPTETTKPVETFKPTETTKPVETFKPTETTKPTEKPADTITVNGALDNIKKICGLKSTVETDIKICAVDVFDKHNPYDVVYDYGKNYNAFVKACDWSLVFDADYYIKQFPMLATLYHNDKALLLEHFQTVGIHEGRQGSAKFNIGAYKANCDSKIRSAFGTNYEGYYFYYMLNYETEKSVKTTGNYKNQYKQIMTACQAAELEGVNGYRDEVNVADIAFHSELAAFANYRAYLNAHDDYRKHEWFDNNSSFLMRNFRTVYNANAISENTCHYDNLCKHEGETFYTYYRNSKPHYEAMIGARYEYIGLSNVYYSCEDNFANQFQTFLDV